MVQSLVTFSEICEMACHYLSIFFVISVIKPNQAFAHGSGALIAVRALQSKSLWIESGSSSFQIADFKN
jgi:hypothetical protein